MTVGRLGKQMKHASEAPHVRITQMVRMRIVTPRMDWFGNIRKASLMKVESGEWKGAAGTKAATEDIDTNKKAARRKMLWRV